MMKKLFYTLLFVALVMKGYAQPANDNCSGSTVAPQDGTCIGGTTVAATDSWAGSVGCQATATPPDVWFTFTATGTQADLVVTNGTMTGNVEIIMVLANCNSQNCNCPFLLAGSDCGASPNSATFTGLVVGETYYYTINSSTGSQGTFTTCLTVTTPPPPPPAPGQDCTDADIMCDGPNFSVPNMQLGDGPVEENWNCILNENNSQWYKFTAGAGGTIEMMFDPGVYNSGTQTGDDYDFLLANITTSGCASSATIVNCDFSGCVGSTGWSSTGAAGFGQIGGTDYQNNNPAGPGDCLSGPQWNTAATSLVAGATYALLVQNYTGSTGGVTITSAGTALFGPQSGFTFSDGCATDLSISVAATYANVQAGWTYSWNWGDATTSTGTTGSHTYAASGSYNVTLTVTDPLGCTQSSFVGTFCMLPIELLYFDGVYEEEKVKLDWSTATETDNDYFSIERSINAKDFEIIGTVDGAGTSVIPIEYRFFDERPLQGLTYYRLKQTDFNGKFEYTEQKAVYVNESTGDISVIPNPAKEDVNIFFTSGTNDEAHIKIVDVTGKTIYRTSVMPSGKTLNHKVNSMDFPKGIYFITVMQGSKVYHTKFTIE